MNLPIGNQQTFNFKTLDEVEKAHIIYALEVMKGNKSLTAKALGITLKTLYNKLHQYNLFELYSIKQK